MDGSESESHSMDNTLSDDAWKDSFDKLLDPRPQLRELNILKRDVRASFNIDSSVENSNSNILNVSDCSRLPAKPRFLATGNVATEAANAKIGRCNTISTPCAKRVVANLFDCAISPITGMKLDGLKAKTGAANVFNKDKSIIFDADGHKPKRVCFELRVPVICVDEEKEKSVQSPVRRRRSKVKSGQLCRDYRSSIILQPGKWRRSLGTYLRSRLNQTPRISAPNESPQACQVEVSDCSVEYVGAVQLLGKRKSVFIKDEPNVIEVSHKKQVLKYCGQRMAKAFHKAYAATMMPNSCKIGEGTFGEVFKYSMPKSPKNDVVLKVIPIEGTIEVNGEPQKTFEQILPEIIISMEMCRLRGYETNSTAGFVDIQKVSLVVGAYPAHLIELWEKYDDEKESENDHPEVFGAEQLFIVLELKFAGEEMSTFPFTNAEQTYYALQQIILTLAVGEEAYQFEHRDLHWGNILIQATDEKQIAYKLNDKALTVPAKGVKITIIDYTLSRINFNDCCHYNDLSTDDELFAATGDYQYDIYRMMRDELNNKWTKYAPKTNVFWLSYVIAKLIDGVTYKSVITKTHKVYMEKLKDLQKIMLTFESAAHCARHVRKLS